MLGVESMDRRLTDIHVKENNAQIGKCIVNNRVNNFRLEI